MGGGNYAVAREMSFWEIFTFLQKLLPQKNKVTVIFKKTTHFDKFKVNCCQGWIIAFQKCLLIHADISKNKIKKSWYVAFYTKTPSRDISQKTD